MLKDSSESLARAIARLLLVVAMVAIGVMHFVDPAPFVKIIPAALPYPLELVWWSGACEILGGVGLVPKRSRRAAGWGLIALFVAVFPANVNMALHEIQLGAAPLPVWALWARLPLQAVFIAWAWWVSRPEK